MVARTAATIKSIPRKMEKIVHARLRSEPSPGTSPTMVPTMPCAMPQPASTTKPRQPLESQVPTFARRAGASVEPHATRRDHSRQ